MWLYHTTKRLRPVWGLYWKLVLCGSLPRELSDGPLIVVANHSSFLDPWFLGLVFPRPVHHVINRRWYERSRGWTAFFDANGTIPTGTTPQGTVDAIRGQLDEGRVVSIFPEGRISADGKLRRFRSGVGYLAAAAGCPVLPLGIRGAFEILPRQRRFPRRGRIELHVGSPRRLETAGTDAPDRRSLAAFCNALRDDVARLSGAEDASGEPSGAIPDPA